ncbi:hypothetical protein RND71_019221 [Anisodus tanguticus]|uniref:Uncharacterized protein n=1 Tax=Anisodus tanguticus TaxID=243964 RepID=A0AAE1RX21_9SOLA|nr:hypothetical protein RND71_019221 [Anisodus tanguticus]
MWGWDNTHVYIGKIQEKQKHKRKEKIDDEKHGLHIISTVEKKVVRTLQRDDMPTVPCRLAAHPYIVGTLAGATGKGKIHFLSWAGLAFVTSTGDLANRSLISST